MKCNRLARVLPLSAFSPQLQSELDYHLLLARDLEALTKTDYERLDGDVTEVKRMLTALTYFNNITGRQSLLWFRLARVGRITP